MFKKFFIELCVMLIGNVRKVSIVDNKDILYIK